MAASTLHIVFDPSAAASLRDALRQARVPTRLPVLAARNFGETCQLRLPAYLASRE